MDRRKPSSPVTHLVLACRGRRGDKDAAGTGNLGLVTIAVDHLTLAATEAGLGSCWICAFDAVKVRQLLQMPASLEPVALLPLGYPAPEATPNSRHSQRKPMDELVQWERF